MRRRAQLGYSLLEVIVAMTIFLIFLATLFALTSDMRAYEKRLPVNFQKHPQIAAVLTRLRRDVIDGIGKNPYLEAHEDYVGGEQVLIVKTLVNGGEQIVVWDFREPGVVRRRAYNASMATDWWARGLPKGFHLEVDAVKTGPRAGWATHIQATDSEGRIAIDQILQPRATE
ncbi:MAG TPA: prepilin-type N-terminal cleavage/methylation domain-containing protein [Thermoanaerobaculia bacterium]